MAYVFDNISSWKRELTTGIESLYYNVNMSIFQLSKEINELFCNLTPHAAHFSSLFSSRSSLIAFFRDEINLSYLQGYKIHFFFSHAFFFRKQMTTCVRSPGNCKNLFFLPFPLSWCLAARSVLNSVKNSGKTFTTQWFLRQFM